MDDSFFEHDSDSPDAESVCAMAANFVALKLATGAGNAT